MKRTRLFELRRQRRIERRKNNRKKLFTAMCVIVCTIMFAGFVTNYAAKYEVPIVDHSSKCIFVLSPDGMTHKIYVDDGYNYNIGDNVIVGINMFAEPEYREVWLIDDLKGGEI